MRVQQRNCWNEPTDKHPADKLSRGRNWEVLGIQALETCGIQDKRRHGMGCQCLIRDSAFHRWCAVQGMPTAMGTSQMGMAGYAQYAQGEVTWVLVYFFSSHVGEQQSIDTTSINFYCCLVCAGQYPGYGTGYGYSDPYGRLQNQSLLWYLFRNPMNFATFRPYGSSMGEQVPSGIFRGESCENFLRFLGTVLRLWLHAGGLWGESTVCTTRALACLGQANASIFRHRTIQFVPSCAVILILDWNVMNSRWMWCHFAQKTRRRRHRHICNSLAVSIVLQTILYRLDCTKSNATFDDNSDLDNCQKTDCSFNNEKSHDMSSSKIDRIQTDWRPGPMTEEERLADERDKASVSFDISSFRKPIIVFQCISGTKTFGGWNSTQKWGTSQEGGCCPLAADFGLEHVFLIICTGHVQIIFCQQTYISIYA